MKRILTIAGSDSGGGAGIQADLKTITVLGGYGMSVLTALTAQNTVGVQGVHLVPTGFIRDQLESVLSDIGADAAKTGMLATPDIVLTVAEEIKRFKVELLVVDPVMVAKSGDLLIDEGARSTLKESLLPLAYLVTPNLPEASVLCGFPVENLEDMKEASKAIHALGPPFVLVKGGHLAGKAVDLLHDGRTFRTFEVHRIHTRNTHGTGCTYSAALATLLAQGLSVPEAVGEAKPFITRAISLGLEIGSGHGPTNHYAHILRWREREDILDKLKEALEFLVREPVGGLIPEVRSNLGYALPGALDSSEIAAVPGRITQMDDKVLACRDPVFGASRHVASVILAAIRFDPALRAAMNIRYSREILTACRELGLSAVSFDRSEEPEEIKEKEGSSLEWGTNRALEDAAVIPDLVYDEGEVGKEPIIRILGKSPMEVVRKAVRIGKEVSDVRH